MIGIVDSHQSRAVTTPWPLWLVLAALAATLAGVGWNAWQATAGHFVYAQDDPYIHLTLARTVAYSGVWGLTPHEFAAASSSPGWTLLLALLMRVHPTVLWPFVINVLCAFGLVIYVEKFLRSRLSDPARAAALLAFIFVLPLTTLVFIGMEHTAHILAVVALCCGTAVRLSDESTSGPWPAGLALAALTAALRYEGLFVVAVLAGLALLRRRPAFAITLMAAAALPVVAYAGYAVTQGGWILPNSIVIKSGAARFAPATALTGLLSSWVGVFSIYLRPPQAALVLTTAALAALAGGRGRAWRPSLLLTAMFIGVETLHLCFVNLEWFYRYEAYAIALGMVAAAATAAELHASGRLTGWSTEPVRRTAVIVLLVMVVLPLFVRGSISLMTTATACQEIYRQQYQMGRFFARYYANAVVALNDIGAVSWMAPVRVLDLIGLASNEIAEARRAGRVNASYLADLASRQGVSAVVIYEAHFRTVGELPAEWIKVGEWSMPSTVAVSGTTVAFFAPTVETADRLARHLEDFSGELPDGVSYARAIPAARP